MKYQSKKIGEIASVKGGKRLPKGMFVIDEPTHHPYLRIVDFADYGIDRSNIKYIDEEAFEKTRRYTIDKADVYISIAGTIGRVGIVPDDLSWANLTENAAKITNISGDVDHKYLMYYLRGSVGQGQIANRTGGTSQPKLALCRIADIDFPCPPLPIQRKAARTLSAYDDLIENNRRRIQLLEQAARLLYKEWFVHLRFPGHEHTQIIAGVPEGWENTLLPDVIDVNPKTPVEKGKEILYVPMSALSEAGMTANTADFERRTTHTAVKFKKSDVLLARITPCLENGKTGYVYFLGDDEVACGSTEFIVLRGKRVSPAFTYCLARSYPFRGNAIKSMIGSSGRQRVQVSCFDEYKVPLPHKHLLEMFDDIANTAFDQIRVLVAQNDKLTKARDLLLPKLMNGEVAV